MVEALFYFFLLMATIKQRSTFRRHSTGHLVPLSGLRGATMSIRSLG